MLQTKLVHAIRVLDHLRKNETGSRLIPAHEFSDACFMSHSYTEQVMAVLKRGDVVDGVRGPMGGYRLNCEDLTLGELTDMFKYSVHPYSKRMLGISVFEVLE